jgi:hypothetical protein
MEFVCMFVLVVEEAGRREERKRDKKKKTCIELIWTKVIFSLELLV